MTDLLLWRHAEAEDVSTTGKDADRALTKRGRKQAASMAKWLDEHLPEGTVVLCSPALRCRETVAALAALNQVEVKVVDFLRVESNLQQIVDALADYEGVSAILLVGHQPNLGLLIAKLLGMQQTAAVVKKGSVSWLRQRIVDEAVTYYIYAVQQPDS